eukprot:scaffold7041_cov311-Pinguiococcus_pyrenoidosus.AAC.1
MPPGREDASLMEYRSSTPHSFSGQTACLASVLSRCLELEVASSGRVQNVGGVAYVGADARDLRKRATDEVGAVLVPIGNEIRARLKDRRRNDAAASALGISTEASASDENRQAVLLHHGARHVGAVTDAQSDQIVAVVLPVRQAAGAQVDLDARNGLPRLRIGHERELRGVHSADLLGPDRRDDAAHRQAAAFELGREAAVGKVAILNEVLDVKDGLEAQVRKRGRSRRGWFRDGERRREIRDGAFLRQPVGFLVERFLKIRLGARAAALEHMLVFGHVQLDVEVRQRRREARLELAVHGGEVAGPADAVHEAVEEDGLGSAAVRVQEDRVPVLELEVAADRAPLWRGATPLVRDDVTGAHAASWCGVFKDAFVVGVGRSGHQEGVRSAGVAQVRHEEGGAGGQILESHDGDAVAIVVLHAGEHHRSLAQALRGRLGPQDGGKDARQNRSSCHCTRLARGAGSGDGFLARMAPSGVATLNGPCAIFAVEAEDSEDGLLTCLAKGIAQLSARFIQLNE